MDTVITKVVIRRWTYRTVGDLPSTSLIALFPEIPATMNLDECESYELVGQHGAANYEHIIAHSIPAGIRESDVMVLIAELKSRGYNLKILTRAPYNAYEKRRQVIQAVSRGCSLCR